MQDRDILIYLLYLNNKIYYFTNIHTLNAEIFPPISSTGFKMPATSYFQFLERNNSANCISKLNYIIYEILCKNDYCYGKM